MNEFVYDVVSNAAERIFQMELQDYYQNTDVIIISDDHEIVQLFCGTVCCLRKYSDNLNVHFIPDRQYDTKDRIDKLCALWNGINIWDSFDEYAANCDRKRKNAGRELFFFFANLRSSRYAEKSTGALKNEQIRSLMKYCAHNQKREIQLITCIPPIREPLPGESNAIAEREYEVVFRNYPKDSPEKYVSYLEDIIRTDPEHVSKCQAVRLDCLFGPGITESDGTCVLDILKEIISTHSISICGRDRREYFSASFVKDALVAILAVKAVGQAGNIYHISSGVFTRFGVISQILTSIPDYPCRIVDETKEIEEEKKAYRILNASKLDTLHLIKRAEFKEEIQDAFLKTALWYMNVQDYVPDNDINIYFGRMNRIRELELELLTKIDSICQENDIQYFLSAGTMLGAVRHHGFIPWDDDVDIGMLPEEYEKFKKVCPGQLGADYSYQSYSTENESHYIHDKIRINNSWFATNYANDRIMKNGVYIDVFVYYKTSDKPFFQKLHLLHIRAARKLIAIRWANEKRKSNHPIVFRLARRTFGLFPFSWFHRYHLHVLRKYEKRKTHYRLDSTGFNLEKVGAVPDEWFHGTKEEIFCGRPFPVLARYDDYLRHWFGNQYMSFPPLPYRCSVHDVKRIDLGKTLFDETRHDARLHEQDLRGELFDQSVSYDAKQ